jgi:hypothetical protein
MFKENILKNMKKKLLFFTPKCFIYCTIGHISLLSFAISFFSINKTGILFLYSAGITQGIADIFYIESFIKNNKTMKLLAYLSFILAVGFLFLYFENEPIIGSAPLLSPIIETVLSIIIDVGLLGTGILGSWAFPISIYVKFIKKYNIKEEDIRFLFYSVLYG